MEGTVNKAAGLVFLLCRCGDRDFHVYLWTSRPATILLLFIVVGF